ncbi:hypothetical protein DW711_11670 [Ruminococcus sp. AM27-16]|nr:hypothetical protein DW711_11670 [Ruminococcus sp. AM27-16]
MHEKRRQNSPAAQTVAFFFHNADSAGLRVATLPTRFTPKENPAYAGSWKIVVTVHTPLSCEVFWHEYAKIPRHTSQNSIAAGNLE